MYSCSSRCFVINNRRQHVMAVSSVSHYKERKKEFTLKENGMND